MGVRHGQPLTVTEFLKPGIEEFCSILPVALGTRILAYAQRHRRLARAHWGMAIDTASIFGYLRFYLLAKLRAWRPKTYRYAQEQRAIEAWLALIAQAAALSAELAIEVAHCARLIKGYGDTHKNGTANYHLITNELIVPALAGAMTARRGADAIASARAAALIDPEGEALRNCLGEIRAQSSRSITAQ
jgi:indolepyruvate ferredoxin oxidoreductase beta subunit